MPPRSELIADRARLKKFILESIRLDALLDARARDIEFINSNGEIFYSPDQSTWASFFFPIENAQQHSGEESSSIKGFAEAFEEPDRSDNPYQDGSSFTGAQVTAMLGKVLMDSIFVPSVDSDLSPDFFLTEESKEGLRQQIHFLLRERERNRRSLSSQKQLSEAFHSLRRAFSSRESDADPKELFVDVPGRAFSEALTGELLRDRSIVNLNERARAYNEIAFFDWDYLREVVENGESDEHTFNFHPSDIRQYERLCENIEAFFFDHLTPNELERSRKKVISMTEILALNVLVNRSGVGKKRFSYLTNSDWAIRFFDRFVWDENANFPLSEVDRYGGSDEFKTVSFLFIRSPLCFSTILS